MKRTTRRIIAWSFIAIFIIVAPLIVLYAIGYRYQWGQRHLVRTGTLVVSSIPRGAMILLNGTSVGTTPMTITSLLPQTYNVTITKSGYLAWHKNFTIHPDEAVFASDIRLFSTQAPSLIASGQTSIVGKSPGGDHYLLLVKDAGRTSLARLTSSTGTIDHFQGTTPAGLTLARIDWSPSEDTVIVDGQSGLFVFSLNNPVVNLNTLAKTSLSSAHFSTTTGEVDATDGKHVYQFSPDLTTVRQIPAVTTDATMITEHWTEDNQEYELIQSNHASSLMVKGGAGTQTYTLPTASPYHRLAQFADALVLEDESNTMTVVRLTGSTVLPLLTVNGVKSLDVDPVHHDVAYTTGFEVWTFTTDTGAKNLLTRLDSPIQSVRTYPLASHVFFTTATDVYAIERDNRDIINQWSLASLPGLAGIAVSLDGSQLFIASTGSTAGLYERPL